MNVYEESLKRIEYLFNEFDNVLVSFSGGKDSTVCLELCYDYAKKNNLLHKLSIVHLDYEAQYQMTTDFVSETFERFSDIKRFWLCLPVYAQCACRMDSYYWIPWEKEKKDIWVRPMPEYDYVINEDNMRFKIKPDDFEIPKDFFRWFSSLYGKTADVIGIRGEESLNRWRAVNKEERKNQYKNLKWTTISGENIINTYPISNWKTEDVFTYLGKFKKPYNKIYDLFYKAGLSIYQMRVASPFNDCGIHSLKLYKVIDPKTWGKMIGRVNGVNFAGLYGGTTAMGWNKITKPKHFTWKQYCEFLLSTLDDKTRKHYQNKLNTSIQFWKEKGGALSEDAIAELGDYPISFGTSNQSTKRTVKFDEYPDELPQIKKNFKEFPSWKRMCICIIKNDYLCKYMGFAQTKEEIIKRKNAIEKYKGL